MPCTVARHLVGWLLSAGPAGHDPRLNRAERIVVLHSVEERPARATAPSAARRDQTRKSGREDLNLRPHGPEPCALTELRYAPNDGIILALMRLYKPAGNSYNEAGSCPYSSVRIEQRFPKPCVAGSNPARGTTVKQRSPTNVGLYFFSKMVRRASPLAGLARRQDGALVDTLVQKESSSPSLLPSSPSWPRRSCCRLSPDPAEQSGTP
jgi:hypothetical protein